MYVKARVEIFKEFSVSEFSLDFRSPGQRVTVVTFSKNPTTKPISLLQIHASIPQSHTGQKCDSKIHGFKIKRSQDYDFFTKKSGYIQYTHARTEREKKKCGSGHRTQL